MDYNVNPDGTIIQTQIIPVADIQSKIDEAQQCINAIILQKDQMDTDIATYQATIDSLTPVLAQAQTNVAQAALA